MKEIINYSTREFLKKDPELQTKYLDLIQYLRPMDTKKKIWELKLKDVTYIRDNYSTDNIWTMVRILVLLGEKDPLSLPILKFFPKYWGIKDQLAYLSTIEEKLRVDEPDTRAEMVGYGKKMAKFGIYNTLIPLAKKLNLTLKEVNEMEYGEVYTILLYNTTESNLQNEMAKIKTL